MPRLATREAVDASKCCCSSCGDSGGVLELSKKSKLVPRHGQTARSSSKHAGFGTYRHIGVTPASRRAVTERSVTSRMLSTKDANCRDLSAGDSVSITSYVAATLPRSTRKPTTTSGGGSSRATGAAAMVAKPSPLRLQCTHTGPDSLLVGYTHPAAAAPQLCTSLTDDQVWQILGAQAAGLIVSSHHMYLLRPRDLSIVARRRLAPCRNCMPGHGRWCLPLCSRSACHYPPAVVEAQPPRCVSVSFVQAGCEGCNLAAGRDVLNSCPPWLLVTRLLAKVHGRLCLPRRLPSMTTVLTPPPQRLA